MIAIYALLIALIAVAAAVAVWMAEKIHQTYLLREDAEARRLARQDAREAML